MVIGIVGSEAAKFTFTGSKRAYELLQALINAPTVTKVVSGKCHLGGIDIWAIQVAREVNKPFVEFPPASHDWPSYKKRNLQIVAASDVVHCITVDKLPKDFKGMTFSRCYHCDSTNHVKSGGCWTMKQAVRRGKQGELHVIENF